MPWPPGTSPEIALPTTVFTNKLWPCPRHAVAINFSATPASGHRIAYSKKFSIHAVMRRKTPLTTWRRE
jgi:hypothetical protein